MSATIEQSMQRINIDRIHLAESVLRAAKVKDEHKENSEYFALKTSIEQHGVLSPIWVRPHPTKDGDFELVNGAQRLSIVKLLGQTEIDAIVRDCDEAGFIDAQLHSNRGVSMKTQDWVSYVKIKSRVLREETGNFPSIREIAESAGVSKSFLEKKLAIGRLPSDIVALVDTGKIPAGQAKQLADAYGKLPEANFKMLVNLLIEGATPEAFNFQLDEALRTARAGKRAGVFATAEAELPFTSRSKEQLKDEFYKIKAQIDELSKKVDKASFADEAAYRAAVARTVGDFKLGYFEALKFSLSIDDETLAQRKAKEEAQKRLRDAKKKAAAAEAADETSDDSAE